jgi:heme-degrading monooxygenase HmoA
LVFARVISAQTRPEGVDGAIRIAQQQLADTREQPGFTGFYLLADRAAGKLVTISLWDSCHDVRAVESRAARLREEAAVEIGIAAPAVGIYEVAVQA